MKGFLKYAVLLSAFQSLTWGNACVSVGAGTGEVHDPSKWTNCGGVYPQPGDSAQILIPMRMTSSWTVSGALVASHPSGGSFQLPALEIRAATAAPAGVGSLIVTNGSLTVRGDIRLTSGNNTSRVSSLTLDSTGGGTVALVFDAAGATTPSSTSYRIWTNDGAAVKHRIVMHGGPANPVVVSSVTTAGAANGIVFDTGTLYDVLSIELSNVVMNDIGTATEPAISDAGFLAASSAGVVDKTFSNVTCNRCGTLYRPGQENSAKVQYSFSRVTTFNTTASYSISMAPAVAKDASSMRQVVDSYFDKGYSPTTGWRDFTLQNDVFDTQTPDGAAQYPAALVDHVIYRLTDCNFHLLPSPTSTYIGIYADTSANTPNNCQGTVVGKGFGTTPTRAQLDHAIYEYGDARAKGGEGTALQIVTADSQVLSNALILPDAQDKTVSSGDINMETNNGTSDRKGQPQEYLHNTIAFGFGLAGGLYEGEQSNGVANGIAAIKSNLFYTTGASNAGDNPLFTFRGHAATLTANTVTPSGLDYNSTFKYAPVNRWLSGFNANCTPCTNNGTPYDIPTTGIVPGGHDVNGVPPDFVWQRLGMPIPPGLREWAKLKYGKPYDAACRGRNTGCFTAGNAMSVFAEAAKAGQLPAVINDYFSSLAYWWSPTNVALKGKGHDGADIGAFSVVDLSKARLNLEFRKRPLRQSRQGDQHLY